MFYNLITKIKKKYVQLKTAVDVAKISTASVGKFQPKISKETISNKKNIPGLKKEKLPAKVPQ